MTFVRKPEFAGYFINPLVAVLQTMFYEFCSVLRNIMPHRLARMLFEIPAEICVGEIEMLTQEISSQLFRVKDIGLYKL